MTGRERFERDYAVDGATMARLDGYAALLSEWQATMNLVARSTLDAIWDRHFADSAQLVAIVGDAASPASRWLDIGSGAGFPALVLALLAPGDFHLVEATAKKCRFLAHVANALGLDGRVTVHHARIEDLSPIGAHFVTARACASLVQLLGWGERHGCDARWLLLKGRSVADEIPVARAQFDFEYRLVPSRTDEEARIVDAHGVRRRRQCG